MTAFKKKVLAFALAGTFALSQSAFVSAAVDTTETTNINKYDTVRKEMNLIQGDGQLVDLHKPLERYRAFVLYARMLGQADELQAYIDAYTTGDNFGDAAGQSPYVQGAMAYFKEKAMSEGDNHGNFRPHDSITGQEFYKMMLQALGYVVDEDFTYAETADKALELNLIADKEIAGTNALEEVQIGAALYDTLNTAVKPAADAAADAPVVILAKKLALQFESAIPYLAAFDKTAPTLTVTEPHAFARDAAGSNAVIADATSINVDVTAMASVDMHDGMPLKGSLSEYGTIYYDFNGVTGSFQTDADGKFDTAAMETPLEGTDGGNFPWIQNDVTGKNKNVVKMWATDLAGNKTKVMDWSNLRRVPRFEVGGTYVASGSTLMVTGTSVDFYFTVDLNSTPTVKTYASATDKEGKAVEFKAITAADLPANLPTISSKFMTQIMDADAKIYVAKINLTDVNTIVKLDATSSAEFGSVARTLPKTYTFQSKAKINLNPVFKGNAGGFIVTFPTEIDVNSADKAKFLRDDKEASSVVVLDDNRTVYAMFENVQSTQYATVSVSGVKSKDGTDVMAQAKTEKITIVDTENPTITNVKIMAPNQARVYFSEPIIGDAAKKAANYTLNGATLAGTVDLKGAYVDIVSPSRFRVGENTLVLNFKDDGVFPFTYGGAANYKFTYAVDNTAPVAELVKLTNNYITVKFPNDKINPASVVANNASWSYSQSKVGAVASAAVYSTNNQGYDTVTYYFANTAMQVGSSVDFVFSGIRDMWNNQMGLTVMNAVALEDKDIATPTFKIDSQGSSDIRYENGVPVGTGIGDKKFIVTFDRPVKVVPGTSNNFVLKDKNGNVVNAFGSFAPDATTVQAGAGVIFGYTKYVFTLPSSQVVVGDYTLTINNILDVTSGKTLSQQVLPPVAAIDNARPRVVSAYKDGSDLLITFNMNMDETSVKVITNYFESNVSGTAVKYLALRDDGTITLSADKRTVRIQSTTVPTYVAVLGVMSAQNVLIAVDQPNYVSQQIGGIGVPQNIMAGASIRATGANKITVALANGVQINNLNYNDIGLKYIYPGTTDEYNLLTQFYPTYSTTINYGTTTNPDAEGHTVITYDFTQFNAYQKDLFSADGRLLDIKTNNYFTPGVGIYAKTNSDPAQIVTRDRFGRTIVADVASNTFANLDKIAPKLNSSVADTQFYPIVPASVDTTQPNAIDATNLAGITTAQAVVYLGFSETITSSSLSAFQGGLTIYNESLGRYMKPEEFRVGLLNDGAVTSKINALYNYERYPYYGTGDVTNYSSNRMNNVVAIYFNATSGVYYNPNTLRITMAAPLYDANGNSSGDLGTINAYTLR